MQCYQKGQGAGHTDEAVGYFTKAESLWTEADGKDKLIYILKARGNVHIRMQNYPKAIQDFNKIIQTKPDNIRHLAEAYMSRGVVMSYSENFDGAIASYKKAIETAPPNLIAVNNLSIVYKKAGHNDLYEANLKKAAELGSQTAISSLYYDLKIDYRPQQKEALAKDEQWQQLLTLEKQGNDLLDQKKNDEAMKVFVEMEDIYQLRGDEENKVYAVNQQSYIEREKGNYQAAENHAVRAVYSSYPSAFSYTQLGYAMYYNGKQVEAVDICKKGLQRFPGNTSIKGAISWMYSKTADDFYNNKEYVKAYNLYYTAFNENDKDANAIKMAGYSAYNAKMNKEALNCFYMAIGTDAGLKGELNQYVEYLKTVVK
ncbi:hypothetical protein [Reichenbachiella sp. MALMAid0571]|uniref:tetratricopeptide repeat protein n=1 Tax=Reichenbachiella sp. MALMAid0571 TaxID=3143939 RepID=UPI0032DE7AFF